MERKESFMSIRYVKAAAAAVLGCLAGTAMGDGADVIVGDLHETVLHGSSGAFSAYSVGTISCNVGNVGLQWIASTNRHPVIGQNMYRLKNGRFEQIGQSWLKHGFTALQGTVCGPCNAWPNGSHLGVGCSDPYGAGLNGSQGGLGPKSEVNASTGFFPYPWINNGNIATTPNPLFKRLVVATAAVDPALPANAGALYFVSGHYVAPDDSEAGNKNNNESYRRATVNANLTLALQGPTQRTKPAIFAWRDHGLGANIPDPNVVINHVDVANDGRIYVGGKAIDLGNGTWRYEYAVQNLSSDRSVQAVSVPFVVGAPSNFGFTDVMYHSGEPYVGTDWTGSFTGGAAVWSSQTFAQNANANAIRWSTLYNFSFETTTPPATGDVTLTLFKPGTPSTVTVNTVIPSPTGIQVPLNDSCASAAPVGIGSLNFNTAGATTDGPDECLNAGSAAIGKDLWYTITNGNCTNPIALTTCGSSFDTKIAVYNAGCPTGPGTAIQCNDDSPECGTNSLQSSLQFVPVAGATYLIRVGGYNNASGPGMLNIAQSSCGGNDFCNQAAWIGDNVAVSGSTSAATGETIGSCGGANNSPDVWFKYRPVNNATVEIDTCGSGYDTVVSVHSACGTNSFVCNDDNGGQGPCPGGLSSFVSFPATAGTTYYVRVAGYNGQTGNYTLRVRNGGGGVPPITDDCSGRQGIALGATPFDTTFATTDGPTHTACNGSGTSTVNNDVWFNYPSGCNGTLTIDTCAAGNTFNSKIAVYDGYGCLNFDSRLLGCSDSGCGNGGLVQIPVTAGSFYTIRVGGGDAASRGAGILTLTCTEGNACNYDFNQDENIDLLDAQQMAQVFVGSLTPEANWLDGDLNNDENADLTDAQILATYVVSGNCPI
jgi:hypothetical protein